MKNSPNWLNGLPALLGLGRSMSNTKGNLRRWSPKNTVGGVIAGCACEQVVIHGITWPAVCMCLVGVIPLCLSFFEPCQQDGTSLR